MKGTARPAAEELAALIHAETGNVVAPARFDFLGEVAQRRAHATGFDAVSDYLRALAAGGLAQEWRQLVPLVTIKESYFFRAPQQFEALARQVLPRLLRARAASRRLRIWSAACARGEEPATLAMLLADRAELAGWEWTILATDVDEEALAGARRGLYGERSVAQVPPPLLARWFARRGKLYELAPELRSRIDYQPLNLAHPPFALPERDYDLILLRNLLIYFGRPLQRRVAAHVARLLARHGHLFLGASETLWQIQDELEAVDLGSCFCYRHRSVQRHGEEKGSTPPSSAGEMTAPPPSRAKEARRAGTTGAAPAQVSTDSVRGARPPAPATVREGLGVSSRERSQEESAGAEAPAAQARSAHECLLAAARDLAADEVAAAGRAVEEALAADPSEPAAHALDGFLHDLAGRKQEAVAAYRAALYLDPALFQPRLLLADCLLRLDQRGGAEHQYREVLACLEGARERSLLILDDLPLPDRERALRRCRQALAAG
jgi:chemotaxis protein methyltransferase CheR